LRPSGAIYRTPGFSLLEASAMDFARGNFIDNQWIKPTGGAVIRSINPATADEVVLEAPTDPAHAALAVAAAARAWPAWAALSADDRMAALRRFGRELAGRTEALARAITMEMGKTIREARIEATSLIQRIELVAEQQLPAVKPWSAQGIAGECRYHPLGVIAVIGPYNFPLHLCHAHIMPALATGNTVVVKPSERTPLAFQRYMEAWAAAGLPPILHMVQGGGDIGRALLATKELRGVALTGSWRTGHAITKAMIDRPEVLVALEMGGQNMAIVLEDADLEQALEGVLLGGYLTTGQRCTCTSRVLVQKSIAPTFIERLKKAVARLTFGDPMGDFYMGPMASIGDRDRVEALCRAGREAGAELLLAPEIRDGGAWRGPSIHLIAKDHDSDYTREEVFGPDLAVTVVDDLDDAIGVVKSSPYGLSVSLFSARRAAFESVYLHTNVGCVNWNRSTNRQSGALPFGGVGKSGNFRAAGSDAVRYTTYPVQVQWNEPGVLENDPFVRQALAAADPLLALETMHRIEEALEPYGIYPEVDATGVSGVVKLPLAELDQPVPLSKALHEQLRLRGIAAEITDTVLRMPLPPGDKTAKQLVKALADGLHAIRALAPQRFLGRRPAGTHVPAGDKLSLPRSESLMRRLLGRAGNAALPTTGMDFVPDDKKPPILDLFRSSGPYLASVDNDPIVLFDAASQIATHAAGLNPPAVLEGLVQGRFGASPIDGADGAANGGPEMARLAAILRDAAGAHPHVRFSNSGAEANEIALATCATKRPCRRGVIAFRGAFHGRTMLALHSTWNPEKRLRFELEGYEARWVDLPVWSTPDKPEAEPAGWLAEWKKPAHERRLASGGDALLTEELRVLADVEAAMADDQVAAVIAEPMQAEGGERYATPRFFRALRVLTELHGVPLIMDEVQCGFHLGGPFFWHRLFDLPTPPDIVTVAKKAQLGVTLSRWPIPVKSEAQTVSAIRGLIYAELLGEAEATRAELMDATWTRLTALATKFPKSVLSPRMLGWSFGFDLPSPEALNHLVNQRLWRGYMIYGAGDRGLRFRFHPEVLPVHVEALFQRLESSVSDLEAGVAATWRAGETAGLADLAPSWPQVVTKLAPGYRIQRVTAAEWPNMRASYESLQKSVYEPARQDDFDLFTALIAEPDAICLAVYHGAFLPKPGSTKPALSPLAAAAGKPGAAPGNSAVGTLVAACIGFPLEHQAELDGPRQDPALGRGDTFYSADVTVHADHRGEGVGRALKEAQVAAVMGAKRPDGGTRFAFMTGRNRVGVTAAMGRLNAEFGAWQVARYAGQYGEPDAATDYYRIALTWPRLPPSATVKPTASSTLDFDQGLERRLGDPRGSGQGADELREHYAEGRLNGSVVNKLSLCNFATPAVVRVHEWLRLQAPKGLQHLILASGRAEACDKTLRALKYHRRAAKIVVSLGPVRAGMSTAAARSMSVAEGDPQNWFGWPTVADPTRDPERALSELKKVLAERGADKILAVAIEPVYQLTGRAVPESFWAPLREVLKQHDVPLLLVETATGGYRSGRGMWRADTLPVPVDAVVYFPGGQLGLGFVSDRYYVGEKLTLISTWDGDELAATRFMWETRAARQLPIAQRADELKKALGALGEVQGEGLYLTVESTQAEVIARRLLERGFRVGLGGSGEERHLRFAPALNVTSDEIGRLAVALREVLA